MIAAVAILAVLVAIRIVIAAETGEPAWCIGPVLVLSITLAIALQGTPEMKVFATRTLEWDAAHRVMRHESKCSTLHGHRYKAEITVSAPQLDEQDRVVDFGVIKERVGAWIDANWDHTTLLNEQDVELLAFVSAEAMPPGRNPGPRGFERIGHVQRKKPFAFKGEPTAETIALVLFHVAAKLIGADDGLTVEKVLVHETPNCYATVTL